MAIRVRILVGSYGDIRQRFATVVINPPGYRGKWNHREANILQFLPGLHLQGPTSSIATALPVTCIHIPATRDYKTILSGSEVPEFKFAIRTRGHDKGFSSIVSS